MTETPKTPGIEEAIALAVANHAGQTDKRGKPYILHPLAVMIAFAEDDPLLQMIAVLHDAVEDSDLTLDDLREAGYPEEVISGIDAVTRRPGEAYGAFLDRAAADPRGWKVKVRDADHNLTRCRLAMADPALPRNVQTEFARMADKYNRAIVRILDRARRSGFKVG